MKAKINLAIFIVMLGTSSLVYSDIVELPLDCAGVYDFNSPLWTTDFDLGVTFTDISHVYMDWSGQITGGLAVQEGSDPFPIDVGIGASLGSNPYLRSTTVWGGEATYIDPQVFDLLSEIELIGTSTWSDLLDGQHTIQIYYKELIILDGSYVEHGSVVLDSASLVVDGTPVPEPATILLLAVGMVGIRRIKRKIPHQGFSHI